MLYPRKEPLAPKNKYFIELILQYPRVRAYFQQFDYIVCSFPPALFQLWMIVANQCNLRIILNIGHRFNIWLRTKTSNEQLKKDIQALWEDKKHIITTCSLYDYHYTEHYLGIKLPQLYTRALNVPLKKSRKKAAKRIILIMKDHNKKSLPIKELNAKYQQFCQVHGLEPQLVFRELKKEIKWYEKIEDLQGYLGILNFPYSSFSISGLEYYELNIPYFYPSLRFLMSYAPTDYQLYECYCTREEYKSMEDDIESKTSPNSQHPQARQHWLGYFSGLHTKNAIIFDTFDDLFQKTIWAEKHYDMISASMYAENKIEREKWQAAWKDLLGI